MTLRSSWKIARSLMTPGSPSPCSHVIAPAVVLGRCVAAVRQPLAPPLRPIQGLASDWRATTIVRSHAGGSLDRHDRRVAIGPIRSGADRTTNAIVPRDRDARVTFQRERKLGRGALGGPSGQGGGAALARMWKQASAPA